MQKYILIIVMAILMSASNYAAADTFLFSGFAFQPTVTQLNIGGVIMPVYTGAYLTSINNGPTFISYCVDLYQTLAFNTAYTDYSIASTNNAALSKLFSAVSAPTSSIEASAMQIAIWEIVTETAPTHDIATGMVQFTGQQAIIAMATNYLNAAENTVLLTDLTYFSSGIHQDVVTSSVREHSTMVLLISGILVGAWRLNRKQ